MTSAVDSAEQTAQAVHNSRAVEVLARLGLASRGLVWLVLALLALSIVRGDQAQADQGGALKELSQTPLGKPLLAVLAVGFAGYGVWCALNAAVGHRDEDGGTRTRHRLKSGFKGLVYLALCVSTVQFLLRGRGDETATSRTAEVMSRPGGRTAIGLVGLVVVGIGIYMLVKGIRRKHAECLEHYRVPRALRRPAVVVGAVGHVGRGVVLGLVGAFLLRSAVLFEPQQKQGLDATLRAVAAQPYGRVLLAVTALGMLAYALWSFFEAAYREV